MQRPTDQPLFSPVPEVDDEGFLHPPWVKYPNIRRGSIGWRMGTGEDYAHEFYSWWSVQPATVRECLVKKYPEPTEWEGFWRMAAGW